MEREDSKLWKYLVWKVCNRSKKPVITKRGKKMGARSLKIHAAVVLFLLTASLGYFSEASEAGSQEIVSDTVSTIEDILEKKTISRFYDPVEIRGEILTELLGRQIPLLRLYSFSDGSFHQVPYQFDEWTSDGYLIVDIGPEANAELANGILDPQDMLAFMARDAGDRVPKSCWPDGVEKGVEIEIVDPVSGGQGWYYLLQFLDQAPEISFGAEEYLEYADEVRIDSRTYGVQGTNRTWKGKVYKSLVHRHVWTTEEAGGDGKDFIDSLRFRFKAKLAFGAIRINFDEGGSVGGWSKMKYGPVRTIARNWIALTLPLGLKSPKFYADAYCYDTLGFTGFQTDVPVNPKHVAANFTMMFGHDMHNPNAYGMEWYNSNNPDGFLIDGVTSPMEEQYDNSADTWRTVVGPNGWVVYRSMWDEFYRSQAEIKVRYSDDRERRQPPEYYPGDLGYAYTESIMKRLKPRKYEFQVDVFVPYHFYDPAGLRMDLIEEVANIRDNPIQVKVGAHEGSNTAWHVTRMEP